LGKFARKSRFKQALVDVDPVVVRGLQVLNEVDACAQRATSDVQQQMVGLEPLSNHEVALELAHDRPLAADSRSMSAPCALLVGERGRVVALLVAVLI